MSNRLKKHLGCSTGQHFYKKKEEEKGMHGKAGEAAQGALRAGAPDSPAPTRRRCAARGTDENAPSVLGWELRTCV